MPESAQNDSEAVPDKYFKNIFIIPAKQVVMMDPLVDILVIIIKTGGLQLRFSYVEQILLIAEAHVTTTVWRHLTWKLRTWLQSLVSMAAHQFQYQDGAEAIPLAPSSG